METSEDKALKARIENIRNLSSENQGSMEFFEAAMLAQAVLYDTVGGAIR